ncbi:MAG TPA: hypothetical protein VGJ81_15300 [Thermoanaerobaculia bacterium]|jgi:hypothetical protein
MDSYPIHQFRFAWRSGTQISTNDLSNWIDIAGLFLSLPDFASGAFLVTLTVPDTWNDKSSCGANFRVTLRAFREATVWGDSELGQGFYFSANANQRVPISLVCKAEYVTDPNKIVTNYALVAQWRACEGGRAYIGPKGLTTLAAVGDTTG